MIRFKILKPLQVALHVDLLNKLIQRLHHLLNCVPLCTIFFNILYVNFLVELLLHVKRVGLAIDDFKSLLLRVSDLTLNHFFKLVKLLHNVCLAFVKSGLYLA